MFREHDENGHPGPISMRRILAFFLAISAVGLFAGALILVNEITWQVFIPGAACLAGTLLLLFFTTWGDIAGAVKAMK